MHTPEAKAAKIRDYCVCVGGVIQQLAVGRC